MNLTLRLLSIVRGSSFILTILVISFLDMEFFIGVVIATTYFFNTLTDVWFMDYLRFIFEFSNLAIGKVAIVIDFRITGLKGVSSFSKLRVKVVRALFYFLTS